MNKNIISDDLQTTLTNVAVFIMLPAIKSEKRKDKNLSSKDKEVIFMSDALELVLKDLANKKLSKPLELLKETVMNIFSYLCVLEITNTSYCFFKNEFEQGNNCTENTLLQLAVKLQFDINDYFLDEDFNDYFLDEE